MGKLNVCKNCGYLTEESVCPICGGKEFVNKYKSLVLIVNPKESYVAYKTGKKNKGLFAVKF